MKNRYCIGSKLPEPTFRALVRAYFMGKTTEDAARALKVSQGAVKNLYRRLTYRLIDDFPVFEFYRDLLGDCFETGGHRVEALKRCLWQCPGDLHYDSPSDREICDGCPFASRFLAFPDHDESVQTMYFARRSLAPLTSFSFVNRAAYFFAQECLFYGPTERRRRQANRFITTLRARPLGSSGSKSQIADRYVEHRGLRPHWYVVGQGPDYYFPNHDMM
ncbi:MAG: sigma-70 region 4 domain-containing protein [Hoeflea sp. D1-CHI-28]